MKTRYLIPLVLFSTIVILFWTGLDLQAGWLPSALTGKPLPQFNLPTLPDDTEINSADVFKGKISLLNVWASWCTACLVEHAYLSDLARDPSVQIIGLNYKDDTTRARSFLSERGNPYRLVFVDRQGKTAIDLGIYGTPETFLINANGVVLYRHTGILNSRVWEKEFLSRIRNEQENV